jgi:hypothetical protein
MTLLMVKQSQRLELSDAGAGLDAGLVAGASGCFAYSKGGMALMAALVAPGK